MGLFGKVLGTALDVAKLPVDFTLDKFTLGGALVGKKESFTVERLKDIAEGADDIVDEVKDIASD